MWLRRLTMTAAPLVLVVWACASAPEVGLDGRPVYRPSQVDTPPVLMGCNSYDPRTANTAVYQRGAVPVRVSFIVTAAGTVEREAIDSRSVRAAAGVQEEGLSLARGCAYAPARLAGEAVAVRLSTVF